MGDHPRRCGENYFCHFTVYRQHGSPPQVRGKLCNIIIFNSLFRDHPRRCGENLDVTTPYIADKGSPPQVRGKPLTSSGESGKSRITPAGAGKTGDVNAEGFGTEDHPRRCGENFDGFIITHKQIGSPPQVRGKLPTACSKTSISRITPAGAGKTQADAVIPVNHEDHPRRCGENCLYSRAEVSRTGSPPQVRGKH